MNLSFTNLNNDNNINNNNNNNTDNNNNNLFKFFNAIIYKYTSICLFKIYLQIFIHIYTYIYLQSYLYLYFYLFKIIYSHSSISVLISPHFFINDQINHTILTLQH